ncbi:mpv17-like protein 2 [Paramacrobiotus metropolitanus]|uniref:mpv17-like protein 2 n=1 Tax=Paramacrobiotus metropolitanus TaxID=2943436 RepID=UPI00244595F1|nr:mpv17-like protein 2 [Paramacrobiotus metropolitanus]
MVALRFLQQANRFFFERHLLITNTLLGGGLMGLGDIIQQTLEIKIFQKAEHYDWSRTGRMGATGFLLGSLGHGWYKILDQKLPGADRTTVIKKVCYDLFVAGPGFAWLFFWGVGVLEKRSLKEIWSEFKVKFPYVFAFDCLLWPPAQAVNFYYLPPRYRMVYVEAVILFWNIVMSYIKHTNLAPIASKL